MPEEDINTLVNDALTCLRWGIWCKTKGNAARGVMVEVLRRASAIVAQEVEDAAKVRE